MTLYDTVYIDNYQGHDTVIHMGQQTADQLLDLLDQMKAAEQNNASACCYSVIAVPVNAWDREYIGTARA